MTISRIETALAGADQTKAVVTGVGAAAGSERSRK
jgi:hypothetical protein